MLFISNQSTNPFFNIAAEEYLLKNFDEDCCMLYFNQPSIIVGKHQNTLAEINYAYVKQNKIPVIRRISGGGTVFHDLGNLNFMFISNGLEGNLVNFKKYTTPIIEALHNLGLDARLEGKNDIRVNGKKISGNAEHIYRNRVMHHGTLLFSAQLNQLTEAIRINPVKYSDKAVKSIRSEVGNISDFLKDGMDIESFSEHIKNHIYKTFKNTSEYILAEIDIHQINKLVDEKYSTWDWNYSYSPNYQLSREFNFFQTKNKVSIEIEKGLMTKINFETNFLGKDQLCNRLINQQHKEEVIAPIFIDLNLEEMLLNFF